MTLRLYHFIDEKYGLEAIKHRRLKISRISELNDPFEFMGVILADELWRRAFTRLKEVLSECSGMICMSRNWHNPLLWSHYADRHRGICLGFEVDEEFFHPVEYRAERLPPDRFDLTPSNPENLEFMLRIARYKFEHWKYEEEYRAFVHVDEIEPETGLAFFHFSDQLKLCDVILGANCPLSRTEIEGHLDQYGFSTRPRKARAAFKTFRVVEQRNKSLW